MLNITLTIISIIVFIFSVTFLALNRKKYGITGVKTLLTPLCFYLIGLIGVLGLWTNSFGILFWLITIFLLIMAAYFTKYFPPPADKTN